MRWKKATYSIMSIRNIATTAKIPASSLYVPTNKSAPKVHTITVITAFVNKFIFILEIILIRSRKQGNSQLHINGLQAVTPHLYRTKIRLISVTAKYFAKNFQFAIIGKI